MDISGVRTWIFDLDDTLYPRSSGMWDQARANIIAYVTRHFSVSDEEARAIQRRLVANYGTTMRGLIEEEGIDPHEFIRFEDGLMDYSCLAPDADLVAAIEALPGRKVVFTNASLPHARAVLAATGLAAAFEDTFDIIAAGFTPKPHRQTYEAALARFGAAAEECCMVDDRDVNLEVPRALGMATLLVDESRAGGAPLEQLDDGRWVTGCLAAALAQLGGGGAERKV